MVSAAFDDIDAPRVALHAAATRSPEPLPPGERLRRLRTRQHMSQLELSLRVGVSQRHLSCIETGRARASREMLLALLDALDAPLPERNETLLCAGYAPAYGQRSLGQQDMGPVLQAIEHLLAAHEAAPALVIDGQWNLVLANEAMRRLLRLLGVDPGVLDRDFNLLRAIFSPGGLKEVCVNRLEVCLSVWQRAEREASHVPGLSALLDELRPYAPKRVGGAANGAPVAPTPLLFTRLLSRAGELAFFSAFTTFGTPLDVTIASLRIEHLFPADEPTRRALQEPH